LTGYLERRYSVKNLRVYGKEPYGVAVIHGGPGAPGEVAPIARELSSLCGILEPLQTKDSVEGQVQELHDVLEKNGYLPVILIGHSWGAWLSILLTARYPSLVKKLILVGSGPFEEEYAINLLGTRLLRLEEKERVEVLSLIETLDNPDTNDKDRLLARFGQLMSKADSYDPLPDNNRESLKAAYDINFRVWGEAEKLRHSGELLEFGKRIHCPVLAIHGDYDSHPSEGVKIPLSRVLKDFRFILLEKCGHYPWLERFAGDKFYDILKSEIKN
jgi:pimeloyl-ACP methyl ester carboxylesterase